MTAEESDGMPAIGLESGFSVFTTVFTTDSKVVGIVSSSSAKRDRR